MSFKVVSGNRLGYLLVERNALHLHHNAHQDRLTDERDRNMFSFVWFVSSSYMYFALVSFLDHNMIQLTCIRYLLNVTSPDGELQTYTQPLSFISFWLSITSTWNPIERSTFVQRICIRLISRSFSSTHCMFSHLSNRIHDPCSSRQTLHLFCERNILNAFITRSRRDLSCHLLPVTFI